MSLTPKEQEENRIANANQASLTRYQLKREKQLKHWDRAFKRLGIQMNVTIRSRNKLVYYDDMIEQVREAIANGVAFRPAKEKKPKAGRMIRL